MPKPSPARYYNATLRKRGSLLIRLDRNMPWLAPHEKRPPTFCDAVISFACRSRCFSSCPYGTRHCHKAEIVCLA